MAVRYPVRPYSYAELDRDSRPGNATQPETIPWVWYDSQDFASLWTNVAFFASTSNDATISNISVANQFSAEQYFRLFAVTLDWLISATTQASSGAATIVDDLLQIQNGSRAIFNLSIMQKIYCQVPIHALHSSGGVYVNYQLGTPTGSGIGNYAMNWNPDGGYDVGGAIVFPPKQVFACSVSGTAAALNATRKGRVSFHGPLSRPVR